MKSKDKVKARKKRHFRIRKKVRGTAECPRLCVFRSLKHFSAQLIDDDRGMTLVELTTLSKDFAEKGGNVAAARKLGTMLAEKAKKNKIEKVIFDRSGYKYHGRVKAMAEGAREAGLKF
ncbi:MAG: 50S ribosomal protein L18 [Candidatus Aureabacteria bacterium]|nr:50S ribosomal protein L18 [Candidatus Auribacterota bacterium]